MKQRIRLTESDLHRIIKESVKQVLNESTQITDPFEIYNTLKYGDFYKAIITQGSGEDLMIINSGKKTGYDWMVCREKDGSTHTWYYPSLEDIEDGIIVNMKVIE